MGLFCTIIIKFIFWFLALIVLFGIFNPYGYFCSGIGARSVSFTICSAMLIIQNITAFMILKISRVSSVKLISILFLAIALVSFLLTWARNEFYPGSFLNILLFHSWSVVGILVCLTLLNKTYLVFIVLFALMLGTTMLSVGVNITNLIILMVLWSSFLSMAFFFDKYRKNIIKFCQSNK